MHDVYEAIERLSSELSLHVARLAAERGWAHKPYSWMVTNGQRPFIVVNTTVAFPGAFFASFTPAFEPFGDMWMIDVRRTDGKERDAWAGGMVVQKNARAWTLMRRGTPVTDDLLREIMEALAGP